jgi:urease accessory protein
MPTGVAIGRSWLRLAQTALVVWIVVLVGSPALAHETGVSTEMGPFGTGFIHPILGVDHLLAMLSVGILSSTLGGRAIWSLPLMFIGFMVGGALMGQALGGLPSWVVEGAIALSVVALGVAILIDKRIPMKLVFACVAFFGSFHGYAHGVETPVWANPTVFIFGFVAGSALIHGQGVFIGEVGKRALSWRPLVRVCGGLFAVVGVLAIGGVL